MVYFPSCNFTRMRPDVSARIREYMKKKEIEVSGCCRPGQKKLDNGDTAVTICETCNIIIGENRPDVIRKSLYEVIDEDLSFPFPDLQGEEITIQDCYRAKDRLKEKAAIRSLLKKMNVHIVELPGTEEEVNFDGTWLFDAVRPNNLAIAPVYFQNLQKIIQVRTPEDNEAYLRSYCRRFTTERVVCYCNSCLTGLELGMPEGRHAVHLAELLFPV